MGTHFERSHSTPAIRGTSLEQHAEQHVRALVGRLILPGTTSENNKHEYREAQTSLGQQHCHVDARLVVCVIHIKLLAVVIRTLQKLVVSVFVIVALDFLAALVLPQRP